MLKLLSSAAKVAFLVLIFTSCAGFLLGRLEAKDFMVLAIAGSSFFFAYKGNKQEYAGK